ncbi:unnamed protein product [Mytilus coruscus]|uniref:Uncharacterized protein n=1 Tax=Mytilus coruscus TaxID=42192 RepID=A0A6J8A9P9_MYTCO|nr:unnamed protein product [Mytilus coruscus]
MTESTKSKEKGQNSTGVGNVDENLLSDESEKTEVSHNESRLIAHCKDRPRCFYIIVSLSILLIISICINIYCMSKEEQSCINDESCQNITSPQMLICNGITNIERILKLELWEEELKIVVQLPTNFILHKIKYDEREIVMCRKKRNYYYISCNKPYNDNCTIIYESAENTSITTIQEAGDRMLTYEIPTKCIDLRAGLDWILPQKCRSPKPKI